jgi:hypothetical protein
MALALFVRVHVNWRAITPMLFVLALEQSIAPCTCQLLKSDLKRIPQSQGALQVSSLFKAWILALSSDKSLLPKF